MRYSRPRGFVDYSTWPNANGVQPVLLTDRELHIVNQLVFPCAMHRDTPGYPVQHGRILPITDNDFSTYLDEVESLRLKLTGGIGMDVANFVKAVVGQCLVYQPALTNVNLAAGTNYENHPAISAGYRMHLTHIAFTYVGTPPTMVRPYLYHGATREYLNTWLKANIVTNCSYGYDLDVWIDSADYLGWSVEGATLNDKWYSYAFGLLVPTA